jgi:hypothetical protein
LPVYQCIFVEFQDGFGPVKEESAMTMNSKQDEHNKCQSLEYGDSDDDESGMFNSLNLLICIHLPIFT